MKELILTYSDGKPLDWIKKAEVPLLSKDNKDIAFGHYSSIPGGSLKIVFLTAGVDFPTDERVVKHYATQSSPRPAASTLSVLTAQRSFRLEAPELWQAAVLISQSPKTQIDHPVVWLTEENKNNSVLILTAEETVNGAYSYGKKKYFPGLSFGSAKIPWLAEDYQFAFIAPPGWKNPTEVKK